MEDIYCEKIIPGLIPIQKVYETDTVLAFYHTKPFWPVHIVVIPKKHISSLLTLTKEEQPIFLELFIVIQEVAKKVTEEHGACRVLTNLGSYQDSKHLHWHVSFGEPLR